MYTAIRSTRRLRETRDVTIPSRGTASSLPVAFRVKPPGQSGRAGECPAAKLPGYLPADRASPAAGPGTAGPDGAAEEAVVEAKAACPEELAAGGPEAAFAAADDSPSDAGTPTFRHSGSIASMIFRRS